MQIAARYLPLILFTLWLLPAGPAWAASGGGEPSEDTDLDGDPIAEILAAQEADGEVDTGPELIEQQAIADILRIGFAESVTPERTVRDAAEGALLDLDGPRWLEQLEREAALARLRGAVTHEVQHVAAKAFDIPLADHPLVDTYVEYFTGRGRWFFARWLARARRYIPVMQPILEKRGLPKDLVYLAMIESGFSSQAVSTAAACGFWQFIRSTGRLYGLRSDFWVDERRDFVAATEAAATYLSKLYDDFGDWHLAWAAYNGGEGRIRRALARYGAGDFWTLIEHQDSLAKETRHYVPKLIAAAIIAKDPKRYGFDVEPLPPLEWEDVEVDDAVDLRVVARHIGVDVEQLRLLNPMLRQDVTPPGRRFTLRVPPGTGEQLAAWLAKLPAAQRLAYHHHRVRAGESLYTLAHRYNTTVAAIREFNRISNPRLIHPGRQLVIPTPRNAVVKHAVVASRGHRRHATHAHSRNRTARPRSTHVVAAGETLWSIAQRYGVTVGQLKDRNGRQSNRIMVGERLRIF